MEFLVRMSNHLPADTPKDVEQQLRTAERELATSFRDAGILRRLWRVPGTRDAVGLWEVEDATALHDALSSLPMFPWLTISVETLATHPQER